LGRPEALLDIMKEKAHGREYDKAAYEAAVKAAVADVVRLQAAAGLDVVTDGEMGKVSFVTYVLERLEGYSSTEGETLLPPSWRVEIDQYPEYYAEYLGKYKNTVSPLRVMECVSDVSYVGAEDVQTDIANLNAALANVDVVEAFMPSASPSGFGANRHYENDLAYELAVGEALREEYLAIVDAGFILQIDDPWLIEILSHDGHSTDADRDRAARDHIEALNHALRDIPTDRIRLHTCYGLNHGPRTNDIAFHDVVPYMLMMNAGAYSFEVANPRHMHEWKVWSEFTLPDDKVLIPGLIGHATNYVEHPELIADMIVNYASLVGRERVIAGADCGFSSRASYHPEVHPTVVWEKFKALAQGAALASERLW
jgi:5-methyltetrahydropteroyltriglutamate--homocysteine methyltransferase